MKKAVFLFIIFLLTGCYGEKQAPEVAIEKTTFSKLQGFDEDDMLGAYSAFIKSCDIISRQKGEYISDANIKINRRDYLSVCAKAKDILPAEFKEFVKSNFTPYSVKYNGDPNGKFTAYYEAEINASHVRTDKYKYPVYGRPYDLIEVNLADFGLSSDNKKIIGRVENGRLKPYLTREEIYQNGANAPVILWGDSYVDIYIMQIQGSALAILPDGNKIRISFAESNGRPFKGIGSILLSKGLLEKGQASMGSIKKWLKSNTGIAEINMNENERYIFHRLGNPEGPMGAQGVPLTAGRSLAVDKSFIPLGALLWLETTKPDGMPLNKLVLAQDIGSAIKGAVRGDYFYGSGGDDILEEAGKMNAKGRYFILIPNQAEDLNG